MCIQPKGLLLTPDTSRMCLLRSLIFLCCFPFFILAAKENVWLWAFAVYLLCVWCVDQIADVVMMLFRGDISEVCVSLWISMTTYNCQAPWPNPVLHAKKVELGSCHLLKGVIFHQRKRQKNTEFAWIFDKEHRKNKYICLQKICDWNAKCVFWFHTNFIIMIALLQILSDTDTLIRYSLFTTLSSMLHTLLTHPWMIKASEDETMLFVC